MAPPMAVPSSGASFHMKSLAQALASPFSNLVQHFNRATADGGAIVGGLVPYEVVSTNARVFIPDIFQPLAFHSSP
jgi:hypothetical protein